MKRQTEIWKRKFAELEAELKNLYKYKLSLISILIELDRRRKTEPNKNDLAYAKQLQAEISYLDGWIKAYLKSIEDYKNKLSDFEQKTETRTFSQYFIKKPLVYTIPVVVLLLIIASLFLFKPIITGYAVFSKETTHNESLNLVLNESGDYTLALNKTGDISSMRATGRVIGNGTARIYIEKDGKRYLIYKNK